MKIGVSGASGHLGRAVVSELLQRAGGHELVAITRTPETVSRPAQGRFGDLITGWHSGISNVMRRKPAKHSRVELLPISIHGTAMTSKRYLPQSHSSRIVGANPFGLLEWNVVVCQSVYQKNRHVASNY